MSVPQPLRPAALVVGHPGHELRLFRWLELARPMVCVLTDGSGSGMVRIESSVELLAASGCHAGPVMGALTDTAAYAAIMECDVASVVALTESIAAALVEQRIEYVVADAFELYNPTHDLCSVVATLAVDRAQAALGTKIELYDYAVTQAASGSGIVVDLEPEDVQRKVAAAHRFVNLRKDVDALLSAVGRREIEREILRPRSTTLTLPTPDEKPLYEVHGEERVAAGRYRHVLRYEEHFVPFVEALAAAFGYDATAVRTAAIS